MWSIILNRVIKEHVCSASEEPLSIYDSQFDGKTSLCSRKCNVLHMKWIGENFNEVGCSMK